MLKLSGFGGFAFPFSTLRILFGIYSQSNPSRANKILRILTVPHIQYLKPLHSAAPEPSEVDVVIKVVPYLSFDAVVTKNSSFVNLSDEEREELRYLEYCALDMLAWIVPACWLGIQLLGFVTIAPYMARAEFRPVLVGEGQVAPINSYW